MELLVSGDSYFYKTKDGKYWCKTIYGYNFWCRYLSEFNSVAIVSRTENVEYSEVEGFLQVDGPNIRVIELPDMRGMKQYVRNYFKFSRAAKSAVENSECAIFRLPSVSATMVLKYYKKKNRPYALEVVADPYDAYSINGLAQFIFTRHLKREAKQATGVSYVTKYFLQTKYPSGLSIYGKKERKFESYYSTIDLQESYFSIPKNFSEKKRFTLIHTANSINNDMKGHTTVLNILHKLVEKKYNVDLIFIGDGDKRQYYEDLSKKMGLEDYVTFTGLLSSSEKVREILMKGDLFVFPTQAEGLPRSIIEAMAVGLPVLSTPVNGIPELLDEEYMFHPFDVVGFTNKIIELLNSPQKLEEVSKNNIEKAKDYRIEALNLRRQKFYSNLKKSVSDNI